MEAHEDKEIARNLWRQHLLAPSTPRLQRWAYFLRFLFLINICILPIDVFFYHRLEFKAAFDVITWTSDFFFVVDFLLRFRRTHREPETNELIVSKKAIAKRYLRTWAAVDFFGAVPWDLLYYRGTDVVNHFRFVKLLKLLRITMMLPEFQRQEKKQGTGKNAYAKRVGKTLFIFFMTAHWVGSMWWFIGVFETENAQAWLMEVGLDPATYDENWLQRPQQRSTPLSKSSTFGQQYWSSIYWAFTSLVKVPWIAPNTIAELLFASFVVFLGAILFAWLLGSIVAAINAVDRSSALRRDKMTLMHLYSDTRHLTGGVKATMTRYVDAMFSFNNDVEGTERLGTLPKGLRASLLEVIYSRLLKESDLLNLCQKGTALMLCGVLQPQVCLAKSLLVENSSIATHLFFLHRGALVITLGQGEAADGAKGKRTSPAKGGKGGGGAPPEKKKGPNLKGKAMLLRRPIERMGQFVGIYDPYDFSARLPIEVVAVKLCQLFAVARHDLIDVIERVGEREAHVLLHALDHEKHLVFEALKINRPDYRLLPPPPPADAPYAAEAEIEAALARLSAGGGEGTPPEGGASGGGGSPAGMRDSRRSSARFTEGARNSRRSSFSLEDGSGVLKKPRRASVVPRRRASTMGSAGSLLSGNGGGGGEGSAAISTAQIWEDQIAEVKGASKALEDSAGEYREEVEKFVKGLGSLEELVQTLEKCAPANRPNWHAQGDAPGALATFFGFGNAASGGDAARAGSPGKLQHLRANPVGDASNRRRLDMLKSFETTIIGQDSNRPAATAAGAAGASAEARSPAASNSENGTVRSDASNPDSGSRLFDNITRMGQEMLRGLGSNRADPADPSRVQEATAGASPAGQRSGSPAQRPPPGPGRQGPGGPQEDLNA